MIDTTEGLLAAAREQGLELRADRVELDRTGADFVVAHAVDAEGTPWVVRSPRRADVVARAAAERRALELVRAQLPVSVPEWRVFSPEVIAYPRLPGEPAAVVDLEAGGYVWRFDETNPPRAFLDSVADAVAALHAIELSAAEAAGLPSRRPDEIREAFAAKADLARTTIDVPDVVWRRWQAWLADESGWPTFSVPIHGDLHPAHLLVDDDNRLVGLLDWTEMQMGDPATDFAILYATLGRDALFAMLERYRAAGGAVWPGMEAHVVETWSAYPVVIAEFARLTGEDGPRQLAQHLVANAAEIAGN